MITSPSRPVERTLRATAGLSALLLFGWVLLRIDPAVVGPLSWDAAELGRWLGDVDPVAVMLAGGRLLGLAFTGYLLLAATLTVVAERAGQQIFVTCLHRLTTHATRQMLQRAVGIGLGASVLLGAGSMGTSEWAIAQVTPASIDDSLTMTLVTPENEVTNPNLPTVDDATNDTNNDTNNDVPRMELMPTNPAPGTDDRLPLEPTATDDQKMPTGDPARPQSGAPAPNQHDAPTLEILATTETAPSLDVDLEMLVEPDTANAVPPADTITTPIHPTDPIEATDPTTAPSVNPTVNPSTSTEAGVEHWVIAPGDHLWHVAATVVQRVNPDASDRDIARYHQRLIARNQERLVLQNDPDFVLPGQTFTLPPLAA